MVLSLMLFALMASPATIQADEATVYIDVVRNGHTEPVDTIYADNHYEFRFWMARDFGAGGMTLPFKIYSPDDLTWAWLAVPGGYGEGSSSVPGYGCACLTFVLGSAFYPGYFDMTGLIVEEFDLDGELSDTIRFGGVGMQGLPKCDLQHQLSLHFRLDPIAPGEVYSLYIDSLNEPPPSYNYLIFTTWNDPVFPSFEVQSGWPVVYCCDVAGDANNDGLTGVGDAVYIVNYVFKGGPPMMCMDKGDANADGSVNVGDAVYMIGFVFTGGPPPQCP